MPEHPAVYDHIAESIDKEDKFSDQQKSDLKEFFLQHYETLSYNESDVRLGEFTTEHFRSIANSRSVDFENGNLVLHGANSMGKTSFIKAILFNIAGIPDSNDYGMTNLVHSDYSTLSTTGFWTIDDSEYTLERNLRKSGPGGGLSGDDEPFLSEGHNTGSSISAKYTSPSKVLEKFGLDELNTLGHNPYEILSLFFLMSEDFTRFLGSKNSDLIDLLFNINTSTVVSAANKRIEALELVPAEEKSVQRLRRYENELNKLISEKGGVESKHENALNELKESQEQLNSIKSTLSGSSEIEGLRSRRNELKAKLADLKSQLNETQESISKKNRLIERYEDTELLDDLQGIGDELRNFMTIPDHCPICTNTVDNEQRERLLHEQLCPLCAKEMPEKRYRKEIENEKSESITEQGTDRYADEVESLRSERDQLLSEKQQLEYRIGATEKNLQEIEQRIENNDFTDLADERDKLERDVRELRDQAVELEVRKDSLQDEIERAEYEIRANEHLKDIAESKEKSEKSFERFKKIVKQASKKRRNKIKEQLVDEMNSLLECFEQGTLSDAYNIKFKTGSSYHYEIETQNGTFDSSKPDESSAEINLHAILLHTAILRRLNKSVNPHPIHMFVIDSPYANEVDRRNAYDITNFLSKLPSLLPGYQIIITSADTEHFEQSQFEDNYQLAEFN